MADRNSLIVFDFDGVICNSFYDSLYTAIYAYFSIKPVNGLPLVKPLLPGQVYQFERDHPEFCRMFYELMPLGNFAMDYYVALEILTSGTFADILTQEDFTGYKESIPQYLLERYSRRFYSFRSDMQTTHTEQWVSLLPAFETIPDTIRSLSSEHRLAIATSKDIRSVDILLHHYGIADCFPAGTILDKDYAESKRAHLVRFHEQQGMPFDHIYFIDDKVLHLISVADLGVVCHLASWGFNTDREYEIARRNNCHVLDLMDLPRIAE